jgi:hypothetical protein
MTQETINAYTRGWRAGYASSAITRRKRNETALLFASFIVAGAAVGAALALFGVSLC